MIKHKKQVFSYASMMWLDVVSKNDLAYGVIDLDGVNMIVVKDGMEKVRSVDNG